MSVSVCVHQSCEYIEHVRVENQSGSQDHRL